MHTGKQKRSETKETRLSQPNAHVNEAKQKEATEMYSVYVGKHAKNERPGKSRGQDKFNSTPKK
jgi:hypothetical protein